MEKIPTAEEFIQNFLIKNHKGNVGSNTEMLMIEFAKLHVEAALKAVFDSMGTNIDPNMGRAEQYYNETFKSE